jgi:hypothetical protein
MEAPKSPKPADSEEKGFVDDTSSQCSVIDEEIAKLQKANRRVIAAEETAMNLSPQNGSAMQEIQAAAANFALIALQAQKTFEMYMKPIASFFETVRAVQVRVGQWMIDHHEQIELMAQALPRIRKALESSGEIGHLGWTVTEEMELPVILHLSQCADPEAANAYMLKYYDETDPTLSGIEERLKQIQCLSPFATGLAQSFVAFRNDQYALVIPFLVSVLEHALRQLDVPRSFPSKDMPKTIRKRSEQIGGGTKIAFAMKSVVSFTRDYFEHFNVQVDVKIGVRRNGIMHGLQVSPNDRIEAIRLYHVIDTIVSLYEPIALIQ